MSGALSQIFAAIPAAATANAIALAWAPILGSSPAVIRGDGFYQIAFTSEQEDRAAEWIRTQINKEPGPVRMNVGGIATKVIVRQYWLHLLAVAAVGAVLGYSVKKKGRRYAR